MQNNPQIQGGGGNSTRTLIITMFSLAGAVRLFFIGRSIYKSLNKDQSGSGGALAVEVAARAAVQVVALQIQLQLQQ